MLEFQPLTENNAGSIAGYFSSGGYLISDYSLGVLLMWEHILYPEFAFSAGCLIIKCKVNGKPVFNFPIPGADNPDVSTAVKNISLYCSENFLQFDISNVPKDKLSLLTDMFPIINISFRRTLSDYLYETADFLSFSGKKYSGQRNHVKRFKKSYPQAVFRQFTSDDSGRIMNFLNKFTDEFHKKSRGAKTELEFAVKMIKFLDSGFFVCGGYELDGEIISFCLSEICGNMLIDHIEKAFPEYEGIYPATVTAFAAEFGSGTLYINREDDAGDRGLRMSKLQYKPVAIVDKYTVRISNELCHIERIPHFASERLTFDAITEGDIPDYNRLCLDIERNKYWGYDYLKDCAEPGENYFFLDQKKDFSVRSAINFAVRLDGQFIGEAIIFNFDYCGSAEVGLRILPEYGGNGYGTEAFNRVCEYALYGIGLSEIRAKCFKENVPSYKMLNSVMRLFSEDEKFFYFRRSF